MNIIHIKIILTPANIRFVTKLCVLHGENTEISKNLAKYRFENNFAGNQNNYGNSRMRSNVAKILIL